MAMSMSMGSDLFSAPPLRLPGLRRTGARAVFVAVWALAAGPVLAGPVDASVAQAPPPDPTELALRWTLAGLSGLGGLSPALPALAAPSPSAPAPRSGVPAAGTEAGVPEPAAYALMGLLLVAAGLAARRWRRGSGGAGRRAGAPAVGAPRSA